MTVQKGRTHVMKIGKTMDSVYVSFRKVLKPSTICKA